jgi:hypothetical protein
VRKGVLIKKNRCVQKNNIAVLVLNGTNGILHLCTRQSVLEFELRYTFLVIIIIASRICIVKIVDISDHGIDSGPISLHPD